MKKNYCLRDINRIFYNFKFRDFNCFKSNSAGVLSYIFFYYFCIIFFFIFIIIKNFSSNGEFYKDNYYKISL
jgi:hypothetical protein